jgi:hypothetical protein
MSGQTAFRGFLLQTLVALLDAVVDDGAWISLALEPSGASEKADFVWEYPEGIRAVQVKSSSRQMSLPDVRAWAAELRRTVQASEYLLVLLGPCSESVATLGEIDGVKVPQPKPLDVQGLVERAAHRLDRFLEQRNVRRVPAFARELLVSALIGKLAEYSTQGARITRLDVVRLLESWVLTLYPSAVADSVEMQSDVLLDTIAFMHPANPPDNLTIVLPMTIVNHGTRAAIVEWIVLRVSGPGAPKLYTPTMTVDFQSLIRGRRHLHADNTIGPFSVFAVGPGAEKQLAIVLTQEANRQDYQVSRWVAGRYEFALYVKYADRELPVLQRTLTHELDQIFLSEYASGNGQVVSVRDIVL